MDSHHLRGLYREPTTREVVFAEGGAGEVITLRAKTKRPERPPPPIRSRKLFLEPSKSDSVILDPRAPR